jgi:hypothetical protein
MSVLAVPTTSAAFASTTQNTAASWSVPTNWVYTTTVTGLNPWLYWKLDDTTTTAADSSGNLRTGTYNPNGNAANFTQGVVGALTSDTPNLAVTLNSANSCINTTSTTAMNAPTQITEVVWFKTNTNQGGKLFGFETPRTGVGVAGAGGTYDRHLYMDGNGRVWFGVYNAGYFTIQSPTALNDNTWHMAAASMGTGGMKLYIDGKLVGTNANTTAETTTGWFRAGCGNLAGWGQQPGHQRRRDRQPHVHRITRRDLGLAVGAYRHPDLADVRRPLTGRGPEAASDHRPRRVGAVPGGSSPALRSVRPPARNTGVGRTVWSGCRPDGRLGCCPDCAGRSPVRFTCANVAARPGATT